MYRNDGNGNMREDNENKNKKHAKIEQLLRKIRKIRLRPRDFTARFISLLTRRDQTILRTDSQNFTPRNAILI